MATVRCVFVHSATESRGRPLCGRWGGFKRWQQISSGWLWQRARGSLTGEVLGWTPQAQAIHRTWALRVIRGWPWSFQQLQGDAVDRRGRRLGSSEKTATSVMKSLVSNFYLRCSAVRSGIQSLVVRAVMWVGLYRDQTGGSGVKPQRRMRISSVC